MIKNTLLYYKNALDLKFPLINLEDQILGFAIKLGKRHYFFRGGDTPFNSGSSINVAGNKFCMNKTLEMAGFPVPRATAYHQDQLKKEKIESLIENLNFPLVVKPMIGTAGGEDVLCNIQNITQLKAYIKDCGKRHAFLSIEEFHGGLTSYRVLVFYNQVIGVVERIPASIVGDGMHSIQTLIHLYNETREKLEDPNSPGYNVADGPIKIDEELHMRLKELQLTLESIPQKDETIILCYTCDSSRGGTMKSLGKKICKENARLLCRAAHILGLNMVGFDVICEDIMMPIQHSRGFIIEANYNPDICIHEHPMSGPRVRITRKILRRLILKHPIRYLYELTHHPSTKAYIRIGFILLILVASWQTFMTILTSH